jgi:hypothetical protein
MIPRVDQVGQRGGRGPVVAGHPFDLDALDRNVDAACPGAADQDGQLTYSHVGSPPAASP